MDKSRIFFYDDQDALCRDGLHLHSVPVKKRGVVFDAEGPPDLDSVMSFAGTVMTLDDGRFRMYYSTRQQDRRTMRIAVAESSDGLSWQRPMLGQMQWEGRDTNHIRVEGLYENANIIQPAVARTPEGKWLMYCWIHGHDQGYMRYIISESKDGIRWKLTDLNRPAIYHPADLEVGQAGWAAGLTAANPNSKFQDKRTVEWIEAKRLRSNDATYVYYNDVENVFEMYSVWLMPTWPETHRYTPHDNAPQVIRTIHRRTSEDGMQWSAPELLITPDEHDPLDMEFYYLSVHRGPEWRIGFLGHYRCWDQTMDVELCFSRDSRRWLRPLRGGWIPRDPLPEKGCMSAYATSDVIEVGDEQIMLYTAGNEKHNRQLPPGVEKAWRGVMAASWPTGRFAGLATSANTIGSLTLKPFIPARAEVCVDADINGWLKAELRDPYGIPLAGHELHNSIPATGDSRQHVLRWQEGKTTAPYRYDAVSLRLEISDGALYSILI
ncbi:MAG: hypothetical protein AB1696_01890 [Planctomycetota bacterium]